MDLKVEEFKSAIFYKCGFFLSVIPPFIAVIEESEIGFILFKSFLDTSFVEANINNNVTNVFNVPFNKNTKFFNEA